MDSSNYYTDKAADQDQLNFKDFSSAILEIIKNADTPMTIGVFGTWGSGKTTLLKMLQRGVDEKNQISIKSVWFTAWKYDNQEAIWRSFILRVLNELYYYEDHKKQIKSTNLTEKQKKLHEDLDHIIESVYQPIDWLEEGVFQYNPKKARIALAKVFPSLLLRLAGQKDIAKDWGIDPDFNAVIIKAQEHHLQQLQFVEQFEDSFKNVLEQRLGEKGRLVVFVDDLDRCLPEKAIEILEAIKLFLNVEGTVFVLGVDREVICRGIEARYQILFKDKSTNQEELPIDGDSYLQKLIQIPFSLPPLDGSGLHDFYTKLQSRKKNNLDELTLGVFTYGVLPNPRQAKRILNIFSLLRKTAENRNKRLEKDGKEQFPYSWPLLAKTVLIQTQWPDLYKIWRQDPELIQTFERVLLSTQYSDEEFRLGRQRQEENGEDQLVENGEKKIVGSDGVLSKHLEKLWKDRHLIRLLEYPNSEKREHMTINQMVSFKEIKTYSEMMGYLALSGSIQQTSESSIIFPELDENRLSWLMSGDQLKINEAINLIDQGDSPEKTKQNYRNKILEKMTGLQTSVRERVNAGNALAVLGDPRFREDFYYLPDDEMLGFVEIPDGEFLMGSDPKIDSRARKNEQPQHEVELPMYYMAKYPVTVGQWQKYVKMPGIQPEYKRRLAGIRNHPVVSVAWYDALDYCEWLNAELKTSDQTPQQIKKLIENGWQIGLPSEAEWEKAARGTDGRIYPYGNQFDPQKGNTSETGIRTTSAVGCFTNSGSPNGCLDMSGNVWEWQPNLCAEYSNFRALRGGSWDNDQNDARCDYCGGYPQGFGAENIGFRICLRLNQEDD